MPAAWQGRLWLVEQENRFAANAGFVVAMVAGDDVAGSQLIEFKRCRIRTGNAPGPGREAFYVHSAARGIEPRVLFKE